MERDIKSALNRAESVGTQTGRGIGRNVAVGLSSSQGEINARASQIGEQIGNVIAKPVGLAIRGLKAGVGVAAVGVAGVLAGALKSGFDRLESIDTAKFKLKALGHTAEDVQAIMDSAMASVKGTSFSLDQSATAAASAVAAGIKPGEQLTKYLTEVADAAAIAGTSFSDMGTIFNQVQTANVAFTGDLRQLADRGLPIFEWLQEATGKTGEEFTKFVEQGGIDAATFQAAIEKNIGGAALTMGESFSGAVEKLKTSVARLGANVLTGILGGDPADPLKGGIAAVQKLTEKFDQIGVWVAAHGPQIHQFFANMVDDIKPVVETLGQVASYLGEHPRQIEAVVVAFGAWKAITGVAALVTALGTVSTALGALPAAATASASGITAAFAGITLPAALGAGALAAGAAADIGAGAYGATHPAEIERQRDEIERRTGTRPSGPFGRAAPRRRPRAYGGALYGSGPKGKDSIPILAAPGEHMLTAGDVDAMGGQGAVYAFRRMLHMQGGGGIPEGPDYYMAAFARNKMFATASGTNYQTALNADQEQQFKNWVKNNNVPFDSAANIVDYDMRGFWLSGAAKSWQQGAHFPDKFKTPYDTTFSGESMYALPGTPFVWQGDSLIDMRTGNPVRYAQGGALGMLHMQGGGRIPWMLADPRGGGDFLHPDQFAPGMDQPPEHEKRYPSLTIPGPGGKFWELIPGIGSGSTKWPKLGPLRPRLPGDPLPPDWSVKFFGMQDGGGLTRDMLDQVSAGFGVTLGSGDRSEPGSYHGTHGGARDYNGPPEKLLPWANWLADNLGSNIDELIFDYPGFNKTIKDGQIKGPFGAFYTLGQAGNHKDHVHVAFGARASQFLGTIGSTPARSTVPLSSLTGSSTQDQVASAIIDEATRRGFSREQTIAVLATGLQESGLNAGTKPGGGGAWHGIFQQDTSYPGRDMPGSNISGFFDRLGAPGSSGGGDIWKQIFALQQGQPFETGRKGYLTEIQSQTAAATKLYDARQKLTTAEEAAVDTTTKLGETTDKTTDKAQSTMDGSGLGQSIISGMLQTIGLDGSLFSNPLEWPNVKSIMAGVNFGASLLKSASGGQGGTGTEHGGGPSLPGMAGLLTPIGPSAPATPMPDATHFGTHAQPGPGPAVVVNGDVGMDPRAFTQRIDAAQNQAWRRNMTAARPG